MKTSDFDYNLPEELIADYPLESRSASRLLIYNNKIEHKFFKDILDYKIFYRTLPLILVVPIGVYIGTKLFTGSSKENYKKYVLYFLILVSIFGIIRISI